MALQNLLDDNHPHNLYETEDYQDQSHLLILISSAGWKGKQEKLLGCIQLGKNGATTIQLEYIYVFIYEKISHKYVVPPIFLSMV